MDSITIDAFAKINLFLEVCERRADSYHNIDSVMQTVSLCDHVSVSKADSIILSNNADLPNNEKNLAYRAATSFFEYTEIKKGAKIYIEKNIPVSAGLAGGSTDAAAVLKALNSIYNTCIDIDTLCALGAKLGADIPFCIKGGCYITKGTGDVFTECSSLPDCFLVISKMGEGVSTPKAYGAIDDMRAFDSLVNKSSQGIAAALNSGCLLSVTNEMYNVFEEVISPLRPAVGIQKKVMLSCGALNAMMSGSGPSVFGVFDEISRAEAAFMQLKEMGAQAFICKPIK